MRILSVPAIGALGLALTLGAFAASPSSGSLPRSTPEAQGVSSAAILNFVEAADREVNEMHSFVLVRNGHVIAEGWWTPYGANDPHTLFSLSKSFTSTAVGLAIHEGKLSLDDEVLKFFPEDAPADAASNLKAMRVRDLLCMSTGHQTEPRLSPTNSEPWTKTFLAHPVPHKPGTHFMYNTPATYMQSAIVQKVTGQSVLEYLRPRLFEPLGIENPTWGTSPQGITLGGYGLSIRTEDIAKFGQLYLQKGEWHGAQLVPADWIELATSRQTSNGSNPRSDWEQGYGFQFWRCRHGNYRGDGAFGQYCIVMPANNAVLAITSGTRDMQRVMNLAWEHLLPAIQQAPLASADDARRKLESGLANLSLRTPEGAASSPMAGKVLGRAFHFPPNSQELESIKLEADAQGRVTSLVLQVKGKEHRLRPGTQEWIKGRLAYGPFDEQPVAVSGAWTSEDTYTVRYCFHETPTTITASIKVGESEISYEAEYGVAFGPTRQPPLIGRALVVSQ